MKAAVLTQINKPLSIINDIPLPKLGLGQVLVKLAYSGVCHSQLMEVKGKRGDDNYLPHLLGHEGAGMVLEVGPGITKVSPGQLVVLSWIKSSGLEGGGTKYKYNNQLGYLNAGSVTTFNDVAIISENRLINLPEGVPLEIGALLGCAVLTGAGIVMNEIKPISGSTIAFFGLGGIGLSALMATKLFACQKVIAIDKSQEKLNLAKDFGATHTINANFLDPLEVILKITNNIGVDYSIEASGKSKVIEQAFASVRKGGGLCTFASHPEANENISLNPYDFICGKQLKGTWGGSSKPDEDVPKLAALYLEGILPLERLITKKYALDEINEALEDLQCGNVNRPIIEINPKF